MTKQFGEEARDYLRLYDQQYFAGNRTVSGYDDYEKCSGVLYSWFCMVNDRFKPKSLLDVGAAYGFMVELGRSINIEAWGLEPSSFARSQVAEPVREYVLPGALPELAWEGELPALRFDVVTCTEVLEHVPEELVPASLQALADKTEQFLVCLIMLEGPGADGDEGHICLKSADWWHKQFAATGLTRAIEHETALNQDPYSVHMLWSGRFFVYARA